MATYSYCGGLVVIHSDGWFRIKGSFWAICDLNAGAYFYRSKLICGVAPYADWYATGVIFEDYFFVLFLFLLYVCVGCSGFY